ncbi:unnamed protein product [Cunninghamella blakesleeana]
MFEKSLTDLIRGIRANKKNEQKYITVCLQEIRTEVKFNDIDMKSMAVAKLTYLQMLGYDMSWASFHIVEVMSSPKFLYKRAGYLAATQSFQQDTDVLMLTTNLIKKDLASPSPLDISIAVNGLSQIVTPDLARDLSQDLVAMLNHSRPYIRKKIVLVLYKIFLKFPEALRLSFPRIKEKLEDPDPSVVSAVVNVICELARKNPKSYLSLAPQLFKLLTTSSNNWMLIKVIKLFASLTPLEPRLIKKLLPPLTSLIQTTPAMSLLYECIYTVITGGFLEAAGESSHALAATCAKKLRTFLEDPDQNLKYVGLLAMGKLLLTHPKLVAEQKDIILECIDDEDISIRLRALDLVVGMVNRKNTMDIVKRLMAHLVPPSTNNSPTSIHEPSTILDPMYRTDIINRIIFICSQNQYHNITNFEWYISILVGLTHTAGVNVGEILNNQLMDVTVRVKSVREYTVKQMFDLLSDKQFLEASKKKDSNIEVLSAAAWICGEYCHYLDNVPATLECLLTPYAIQLPVKVQTIYVQNIIKVYAYWVTELLPQWNLELQGEFMKVTRVMSDKMDMFIQSTDLEVQERARNVKAIFAIVLETVNEFLCETNGHGPLLLEGLPSLFFIYELNPVAPKAQKKVPIPEGLDLDAWINAPLPSLVEDIYSEDSSVEEIIVQKSKTKSKKKKSKGSSKRHDIESDGEKEKRRAERIEARRNDPYYIMSDKPEKKKHERLLELEEDVDSIPIVKLSLDEVGGKSSKSKKSKGSKKRSGRAQTPPPPIYAEEEMPENATLSASDNETENKKNTKKKQSTVAYEKKDAHDIFANNEDTGLNDVDLSTPIGDEERLPQIQSYMSPEELRRKEEIRVKQERKELRAKLKNAETTEKKEMKSEKSTVKKSKSSKASKDKKKKKKPSKTATKVDHEEIVDEASAVSLVDEIKQALKLTKEQHIFTLFVDDKIEVNYTLQILDGQPIINNNLPIINIKFFIQNKLSDNLIPNVHLEFAESFDTKLIDYKENSDIASVTEKFELNANEKVECQGYFEITGNIRQGLCLRGELYYNLEESSGGEQYHQPIELIIPMNSFFLCDTTMDPSQFASLLAQHGEQFEYHENVLKPVTKFQIDSDNEKLLVELLTEVSKTSGLQVVEVVPGAASLYGKTVNGVQIAGLLKYIVNTNDEDEDNVDDSSSASISIDLKATDGSFLHDLVLELESLII